MTTVRKAFSRNFKRLLVEQDYSMKNFAYIHGFDYSAVWNWAHGRACPNLETAFRIAKALEISMDKLVEGAEIEKLVSEC